jgi:hypothetical protein
MTLNIGVYPALEFDPDRFIDERLGKYLTPNPFIFLPFNAGESDPTIYLLRVHEPRTHSYLSSQALESA